MAKTKSVYDPIEESDIGAFSPSSLVLKISAISCFSCVYNNGTRQSAPESRAGWPFSRLCTEESCARDRAKIDLW